MLPRKFALLNFDPLSDRDGIWYLSHLAAEVQSGRGQFEGRNTAGGGGNITRYRRSFAFPLWRAKCPIWRPPASFRFRSLRRRHPHDEVRPVPDVQVSRVAWNGKEIAFVQESRKTRRVLLPQMPEALVKGRTYQITFDFAGGAVGLGSSRTAWPGYPSPSGPASRATYNLEFHIPRGSTHRKRRQSRHADARGRV